MAVGSRCRHPFASLLVAAGFLLLYLGNGRQALHGFDAVRAIWAVRSGQGQVTGHFLYFPLGRVWWLLMEPFGLSVHDALRVLSAVSVAASVFFAHRAALALRMQPRAALLAALGYGCMPAVLYFACIVEVDGVILGASAVTWLLAIRLGRRPMAARGLWLGAVTGITAGLHGGGHLLLASACLLLLCSWAQRSRQRGQWRPLQRAMPRLLLAVLAHAAVYLSLSRVAGHHGQAAMAGNVVLLAPQWSRWPSTLLREWLLPFAPFSVLWLGSLFRKQLRWLACGYALCLTGYLALTNSVIAHFESLGPGSLERGAFLVGIALPMVVLGMVWLRPVLRVCAVAVAAVIALIDVRSFEWEPMPRGFDAALLRMVKAEPMEIWTDDFQREHGWVLKDVPGVRVFCAGELQIQILKLERAGITVDDERLGIWFDLRYDALQQERLGLAFTNAALDALRASSDPRVRRLVEQHLGARYVLDPVVEEPVHAFRVRRR